LIIYPSWFRRKVMVFSIRENTMARTWLRIGFWCITALTGFLLVVKLGICLALMVYYRPPLEHAYNDTLALQDISRLALLREADAFVSLAVWITAICTAALGAGWVAVRYCHAERNL
jgi:hypothetical protein